MSPLRYRRSAGWIAALCICAGSGCVTTPYRYSNFRAAEEDQPPLVVEYGAPHKTLDRIGWVVGWPARVLSCNSKVNNHQISEETLEKLSAYLAKNDLNDVFIAVNQYAPKDQWRRLRENTRIAPGWRYSVGALSVIAYTVFPGRIFGGDVYNPYTNSLYVNSDAPAVLLCEAAFAKDVHARKLPGTYSMVNELPFVSLWRQSLAVGDVLGYAREIDDWEVEKQTYYVVFPQIGAHSAMAADPFVPLIVSPALGLGGAVVGHTTGRALAARRAKELGLSDASQSPEPSAETPDDPVEPTGHAVVQ